MGASRPVTPARLPPMRIGWLRGLSGTAAAGLAVLAAALAVVWAVAASAGSPGPGAGTLLWHGGGAVVALAGQVYADRTPGRRGALAALGVLGVVIGVLVGQWLV